MTTRTNLRVGVSDSVEEILEQANPCCFDRFMEWACRAFAVDFILTVKREGELKTQSSIIVHKTPTVIHTVYDTQNNHIEIKFNEDMYKTIAILKLLKLIVVYHPFLMTLKFKPQINQNVLLELNKILIKSSICYVNLDGCFIEKSNYYIILNETTNLISLSLSRCLIEDIAIEMIADKLKYPKPASKTLRILILSSNKITDVGAKSLATALRSNRHLMHLDMSGNIIKDGGAIAILTALVAFPLTDSEVFEYRKRHLNFLKRNVDFTTNEKILPPKVNKPSISGRKTKIIVNKQKEQTSKEAVEGTPPKDTEDPFSDSFLVDNVLNVRGNFVLQNLNLAFNDISYITVRKLLDVLTFQSKLTSFPQGLIKVCIEGNLLPGRCEEFTAIDLILKCKVTLSGVSSSTGRNRRKTSISTVN